MLVARLALLVVPVFSCRAEGPFRDLPFDQALARAEKEQKIVFIDFFTTWCGPCKKLDASTWKDEAVEKWFAEKTVALRLDAEKEADLAKRFHVEGYPTLLLLKPDGTEIDRMVGYRDAKTFLSEVSDALAGKDAISRAKEQLAGHEKDPMARQFYADELARKGRYEEALSEYLWCFDHGKENPVYQGVRLSFLLNAIEQLGGRYPPALAALEERRDAAEARVRDGSADKDDPVDAIAISRELKDNARMLALFDSMREKGEMSGLVRISFLQGLLEPFSKAKRYADLLWLVNKPESFVKDSIRMAKMTASLSNAKDESRREIMESALAYARKSVISRCSLVYEALLATDEDAQAATIADLLIEFAPVGQTYAAMIEAAVRADAQETAKTLAERGSSLPEKEADIVRDAAKKTGEPR
jgi:thiol-disulfide isomerase/thioredoxin